MIFLFKFVSNVISDIIQTKLNQTSYLHLKDGINLLMHQISQIDFNGVIYCFIIEYCIFNISSCRFSYIGLS